MMVIYVPVKFEFDWTNRFRVRVRKRKMWTDVGHISLIGGLVTCNPPKNYDGHLQPLSNVPTNYQIPTLYSFRDIAWTKF